MSEEGKGMKTASVPGMTGLDGNISDYRGDKARGIRSKEAKKQALNDA